MYIAKEYPAFTATVGISALLFVGGVVFAFISSEQAQTAEKNYKKTEQRLQALLTYSPAPTKENLMLAKQNVAKLQIQADKRMDATRGRMPDFTKRSRVPANQSEMFFQLQAYRNQFNADAVDLAKQHEQTELAEGKAKEDILSILQVPNNFAFGFSRYMNEPPKDDHIEAVHRQKEVLSYILRKLYNSRPHSIQAVMRESLVKQPQVNLRRSKAKTYNDEFVMDEHLSSAHEGAVDTFAFKIEFTGYTKSLRSFLRQIESFELPLVVRSVEVKPIEVTEVAQAPVSQNSGFAAFFGDESSTTATPETTRDPVVSNNVSLYSVIIEYIEVKSANFNNIAQDQEDEENADS